MGVKRRRKNPTSSHVKCYFVRTESSWTMDKDKPYVLHNKSLKEARSTFMHVHTTSSLGKYMARFSLILSKTIKLDINFTSVHIVEIEDIPCTDEEGCIIFNEDGEPMIYTDETGCISEDLTMKCPGKILKGHCLFGRDVQPFGVHWCPFGRLAEVTSSFEDGESSPALSFQDILGRHAIYTGHPPTSSTALTCLTCSRFIFQLPQLLMFFLKVLLRVLHITITGVRSLAHWMSTVLMLYLQLIDIIISGNIILQHSFLMAPVLIVGIRLQFLLQRGLRDLIQMVFQGQGHLSIPLWSGTVPGLLAHFLPHWFHRISPTLELRRMFMSTPKATMEPPLQVYGDLEVRGALLPLDQHQSLHQITLASITSSLPRKLLVKAYKM